MSLPQPRNVLPLEGQIDLNVSAKVTETINELIEEKPTQSRTAAAEPPPSSWGGPGFYQK
jgi:hypothetical protein